MQVWRRDLSGLGATVICLCSACDGYQIPLAGFLGDGDGDGADQRGRGREQRDPEQSVAGGGTRDQCGGDQRGEPAAQGGGQLVPEGCTGVPVSRGEDLGGERRQWPVHGGLDEG